MYKFNKPLKISSTFILALALSACNNDNSPKTSETITENKTVASKALKTVVAPSDKNYKEITIALGGFKLGKEATKEEIAGWHIEVSHNHNLPPGSGTAADGEELFDDQCASCHGSFGEGVGRNPVLAGGEDTLDDKMKPERTVGSYWPYASTLLDYTHRAMPFNSAQSLTWDQTWSLSAYVLYLNDIIEDEEFVFSAESYHEITMPNQEGFVIKDSGSTNHNPDTQNKRCMKDCKDPKSISIKTALLGYGSGAEDVVEETAIVKGHEIGQKVYDATCRLCHGPGLAGAPTVEDNLTWENRLKQGLSKVHKHAIDGFQGQYGFMPPRGGNAELTDEEVIAAVDFMLKDIEK